MACVTEPLSEAQQRILAKTGHDISCIKRIVPDSE
jgi:hypothetical protein